MVGKSKRHISITKLFHLIVLLVLCIDLFRSSCRAEELSEQGPGADQQSAQPQQQSDISQQSAATTQDEGPKMIHEDNPEHETMTEAHLARDKDPIRMDPNSVKDDTLRGAYKPTYNRAKFQLKADRDAYQEFLQEEEKEKNIMKYKDQWLAAQSAIKQSYYSNIKDQKFDEFMINGFIGVMVVFMLIIILCFVFRKYCTHSLIGANKDMEQLDREAYDDLKKEYMERRRAKIAEQRQAQYKQDPATPSSSGNMPAKKKQEIEMNNLK